MTEQQRRAQVRPGPVRRALREPELSEPQLRPEPELSLPELSLSEPDVLRA